MREKTQEQHRKLLTLAGHGDAPGLETLLSDFLAQADTNHVQDVLHAKTGEGLLHVAARGGHLQCLQLLLDVGCQECLYILPYHGGVLLVKLQSSCLSIKYLTVRKCFWTIYH